MPRSVRRPYGFLIKSSKNMFSRPGSSSLKAKLEDSSKPLRILAYPFKQCLLELVSGQVKTPNCIWILSKSWKTDFLTGVPNYNNSCQHTPVFLHRMKIVGYSTSILRTEKPVQVYQEQIHLALIMLHESGTKCQLLLERRMPILQRTDELSLQGILELDYRSKCFYIAYTPKPINLERNVSTGEHWLENDRMNPPS